MDSDNDNDMDLTSEESNSTTITESSGSIEVDPYEAGDEESTVESTDSEIPCGQTNYNKDVDYTSNIENWESDGSQTSTNTIIGQ